MVLSPDYRRRIRARFDRNATLQEKAAATIAERIYQAEQDQHQALLRCAVSWGITAEPDTIKPGVWVTRMGDTAPYGNRGKYRINLTTTSKCTCKEFRIFGRCPCQALVIEMLRAGSITSMGALHHRLDEVA